MYIWLSNCQGQRNILHHTALVFLQLWLKPKAWFCNDHAQYWNWFLNCLCYIKANWEERIFLIFPKDSIICMKVQLPSIINSFPITQNYHGSGLFQIKNIMKKHSVDQIVFHRTLKTVRGNSKIRTLKESLGALNKTQGRGSSLVHFFPASTWR